MRRFVAGLLICWGLLAVGTGPSMAVVILNFPKTVRAPSSATAARYLLGREISLKGTKLVTNVGTYDISSVPDVENRVADGSAMVPSGQRPQVELVFHGAQLVKVVIY